MCLPTPYRQRCLTLAHDYFGHAGRNKMTQHIKRYFYWPSMMADSAKHIKECDTCQRNDKTLPRHMIMQPREIVMLPSEWVAIDIVGPFPMAKGGFNYIFTYLDMATRWPEAIPLRKTATRIVIDQLTQVFARNDVSVGQWASICLGNIQEVLKRTGDRPCVCLTIPPTREWSDGEISQCSETKGNVPMSLYFIRCMPNRFTGLSPFSLKHG